MRQSHVIYEKVCCNGRADGVGDQLRNRAECCTEYTEKFAAVAQFDELSDGKTPGLTPTVNAVSGERDEQCNRGDDRIPEAQRESDLIISFAPSNQRDDGKRSLHCPDRQHIAPGDPTGGEKIHCVAGVSFRIERDPQQACHRNDYDDPVNDAHDTFFPISKYKLEKGFLFSKLIP